MPRWNTLNSFDFRFFLSGTRTLTLKTPSLPGLRYLSYGNTSRHLGHTESQDPIHASEFHDAFHSIWKPVAIGDRHRDSTIGIAVSGGLDSMALARLCWEFMMFPRNDLDSKIYFHAFVVDHCARPSSRIEAQIVGQCLESLEIPCTILTLQWPKGVYPNQLPNFETLARRMRYQALGSACRDRQIQSLLVAHHRDDQAETVFLRISQGHRGTGLKGIQPVAELPECWGIHGVHQSGGGEFEDLMKSESSRDRRGLPPTKRSMKFLKKRKYGSYSLNLQYEEPEKKADQPLDFEDGGINIYRPLLGFSKERLEATCRHWETTWIEDETNSNPKLTSRNAIRHILKGSEMPYVLRTEAILRLQERVQQKTLKRITTANKWLEKCNIMFLNTRSAGLVVRFPSRIRYNWSLFGEEYEHDEANMQHLAALLLRRIVKFVTPQETVSLQSLKFAVDAIFPDIKDYIFTIRDKTPKPSKFTAAGVSFVRIDRPLSTSPEDPSQSLLDPKFAWALTRQPIPTNSRTPQIQIYPRTTPPQNAIPPSTLPPPPFSLQNTTTATTTTTTKPNFHLWDGRFWLRIHNPFPSPLIIRPLHPTDLISLRASSQSKSHLGSLTALLREAAPGKIRYTLPVIAELGWEGAGKSVVAVDGEIGGGGSGEGEGREEEVEGGAEIFRGKVLALPTLGWSDEDAKAKGLRWEARYKKVDLKAVGREGCVIV